MELKPDDRWKGVYEIDTYHKYIEKLGSPILLMESVDEDIQGIFRLVNKLIALGYFEYELWDLACMKALLAFELALKKRYSQLYAGGVPKGMSLKSLIEWFRKNNYFETDSEAYLDNIRLIRNHFAHPEYHSFGGPIISWHISAAAGLINDLYEDRKLRVERNEEVIQLNEKLQPLIQNGVILTIEGEAPIFVYRFIAGFINNKKNDKEYHFVYRPAFVLPEQYQKGDSVPVYSAYKISCNDYHFDNSGELSGLDKNGRCLFTLTQALGDTQHQWKNWHGAYQAYLKVCPHFELRDSRSIGEMVGQIKWDFHY